MTASESADTAPLPDRYGVSPQAIRPVTIRQLLDATREHSRAPFKIDDIEVLYISLVAHVIDIRPFGSLTIYELEDGTSRGRIDAKIWKSDVKGEDLPEDPSQLYVHVSGTLKTTESSGRHVIVATHVRKVTDVANQLFFHILDTAFATLSLERGPPPASALSRIEPRLSSTFSSPLVSRKVPATPSRPGLNGSSSRPKQVIPARTLEPPRTPSLPRQRVPPAPVRQSTPITPIRPSTPVRQPAPPASPTPSPPPRSPSPGPSSPPPPPPPQTPPARPARSKRRLPGVKKDPYADLSVLQRSILLQLMNAPPSEDGMSLEAILRGVGHYEVTSDQVGDALDKLEELEHIETTIDHVHYAIKTNHYPRSP